MSVQFLYFETASLLLDFGLANDCIYSLMTSFLPE